MPTMQLTNHLDENVVELVIRLTGRCAEFDGVRPLNESALLGLRAGQDTKHALLTDDGQLVGYAQFDRRDIQLFVSPDYRGHGLGRAFATELDASWPAAGWWSFGTLPAAKKIAAHLELRPARKLAKMEMPVAGEFTVPDFNGYRVAAFEDADLDGLIAVNARAFADHPEQGEMDAEDARRRMGQDWFRPADLLLLKDPDGKVVGFHWTKVEADVGEVYVLAIDPAVAGRGLGRKLLQMGLHHLQVRGASRIELYVEKSNAPVVQLYQTAGFEITKIDTNYAPASPVSRRATSDSNE